MKNRYFKKYDKYNYMKENFKVLFIGLPIVIVMILISDIVFNKLTIGYSLGVILLITQQLLGRRKIEYYITLIEIYENEVRIEYLHLGRPIILEGNIEDVKVQKKKELVLFGNPYLEIKLNSLKIRQHKLSEWNNKELENFYSYIYIYIYI